MHNQRAETCQDAHESGCATYMYQRRPMTTFRDYLPCLKAKKYL